MHVYASKYVCTCVAYICIHTYMYIQKNNIVYCVEWGQFEFFCWERMSMDILPPIQDRRAAAYSRVFVAFSTMGSVQCKVKLGARDELHRVTHFLFMSTQLKFCMRASIGPTCCVLRFQWFPAPSLFTLIMTITVLTVNSLQFSWWANCILVCLISEAENYSHKPTNYTQQLKLALA